MSYNLPPGVTQDDVDRAYGYLDYEPDAADDAMIAQGMCPRCRGGLDRKEHDECWTVSCSANCGWLGDEIQKPKRICAGCQKPVEPGMKSDLCFACNAEMLAWFEGRL